MEFTHRQSAHCENGVVSNLMRHNGFDVSEPMVFGIGSGLLFSYLPFLKVNYAPVFTYRSLPGKIFERFSKRVEVTMKKEKFRDPKTAQKRLDANLAAGNPVGLQVGVYHLPYFPDDYRFHFNAHNTIVYGKEGTTYLVSDPVMEAVTTISEQDLEKARFAKGAFAPKGHLYYPIGFPKNLELDRAIVKGIRQTSRDMTAPVPLVGVKAIRWVASNLRKWPGKLGPKKTNHYIGQIVRMQEEIGTGGGGFRFIYAAFLQEAGHKLDNNHLLEASQAMTAIGDQWRQFALDASRLYKDRGGKDLTYDHLAQRLSALADQEELFFKSLGKMV